MSMFCFSIKSNQSFENSVAEENPQPLTLNDTPATILELHVRKEKCLKKNQSQLIVHN